MKRFYWILCLASQKELCACSSKMKLNKWQTEYTLYFVRNVNEFLKLIQIHECSISPAKIYHIWYANILFVFSFFLVSSVSQSVCLKCERIPKNFMFTWNNVEIGFVNHQLHHITSHVGQIITNFIKISVLVCIWCADEFVAINWNSKIVSNLCSFFIHEVKQNKTKIDEDK